jgi:biotin synthase
VPINQLVRVPGTPLEHAAPVDPFDFIRTIAVARIMLPQAQVRLSAGRESMSDELQALAFLAGANSIFYGEKLLTTGNPDVARDQALLRRLGMQAEDLPQALASHAAANGATANDAAARGAAASSGSTVRPTAASA